MRSPVEIRQASTDDMPALHAVDEIAFHYVAHPSEVELAERLLEVDRMLGAFEGPTAVGLASTYSLTMTVPGGSLPVAGVTWVGVLPTHRRRGILTALMTHQLTSYHDEGREAVAALWASEPAIYPRFGYGCGTQRIELVIPRAGNAFGRPSAGTAEAGLWLQVIKPHEAMEHLRAAYDASAGARPGWVARTEAGWAAALFDPEHRRGGGTALLGVLARDADGVRGYALYSVTDASGDSELKVRDVVATDPTAYAALWRYLLDIDLVASVRVAGRPPDDPLLHLLADTRSARVGLKDGLWVRLVDVDRALAARTYAREVDVVVEVADDLCPWNAGRWRLAGGPAGASVERTSAPVDLRLTAAELGAAYLGGTHLSALAAAGRVDEHRPGAVLALSTAMASDLAPWCTVQF